MGGKKNPQLVGGAHEARDHADLDVRTLVQAGGERDERRESCLDELVGARANMLTC